MSNYRINQESIIVDLNIKSLSNLLDELVNNFYDDDFNGNNGFEHVSDRAKRLSYNSDMDYVYDTLFLEYTNDWSNANTEKQKNIVEEVVDKYFEFFMGENSEYFKYIVNTEFVYDKAVITVAYITEV